MANLVCKPNFTISPQVRKALRRTRRYRELQKRVVKRTGLSKATVSLAATGRRPGRYKRAELALLAELARLEPELKGLVAEMKAGLKDGKRDPSTRRGGLRVIHGANHG